MLFRGEAGVIVTSRRDERETVHDVGARASTTPRGDAEFSRQADVRIGVVGATRM